MRYLMRSAFVLVLVILSGCKPPVINAFDISRDEIFTGEKILLTWDVAFDESASDHSLKLYSNGELMLSDLAARGDLLLSPSVATAYELVAEQQASGLRSASEELALTVNCISPGSENSTGCLEDQVVSLGWNLDWSADEVWEFGPLNFTDENDELVTCYVSDICAATGLDNPYDNVHNKGILVSPAFQLPALSQGEEAHLHLYSQSFYDLNSSSSKGFIFIREQEEDGSWGARQFVTAPLTSGRVANTEGWVLITRNLTQWQNKTVRLEFEHDSSFTERKHGWMMDGVEVRIQTPKMNGSFESNASHWSIVNGVWKIGSVDFIDDRGAHVSCFSGQYCAATGLEDPYNNIHNEDRLITPTIALPELANGEELQLALRSRSMYRTANSTSKAFIYVREVMNGETSVAELLTDSNNSARVVNANDWVLINRDLSKWQGKTIRLEFDHDSGAAGMAQGWLIDDIEIKKFSPKDKGRWDGDFEIFNADWGINNGLWQIGELNYTDAEGIPVTCYSGNRCAATGLTAPFSNRNNEDTLSSPSYKLPIAAGEEKIELSFYTRAFYRNTASSKGFIYVHEQADDGTWVAGALLGAAVVAGADDWELVTRDLTQWQGKTIRLEFDHDSSSLDMPQGWIIDNVNIDKL